MSTAYFFSILPVLRNGTAADLIALLQEYSNCGVPLDKITFCIFEPEGEAELEINALRPDDDDDIRSAPPNP